MSKNKTPVVPEKEVTPIVVPAPEVTPEVAEIQEPEVIEPPVEEPEIDKASPPQSESTDESLVETPVEETYTGVHHYNVAHAPDEPEVEAAVYVEPPVEEIAVQEEVVVEEPEVVTYTDEEIRAMSLKNELDSYKELLTEYAATMGPTSSYVPFYANIQQHKLIKLVEHWITLGESKTLDTVEHFYAIGKLLRGWFSDNVVEGCASAELLHRGIIHPDIGLTEKKYKRHLTVCNLFTRLVNSSVRSVMSGNDKEVYDHFSEAEMKPRFLDLVAEGIRTNKL